MSNESEDNSNNVTEAETIVNNEVPQSEIGEIYSVLINPRIFGHLYVHMQDGCQ